MGRKVFSSIILASVLLSMLYTTLAIRSGSAWSNGGYSTDPSNPSYGTHDWIAQHALDWLPTEEKEYITNRLTLYLYGTELPDNGGAPDGIGDVALHHVYYWANESIQDDSSADRAQAEYDTSVAQLKSGNTAMAVKTLGIMSHYVVDVGVFGHVMGDGTDWGPETHHSDYETYVNEQTNSYDDGFNAYLAFDGSLDNISAYDATLTLAFNTTFGDDGNYNCTWMDQNYDWNSTTFRNRCTESLNLAVNCLTDVLHTLWINLQGIFGEVTELYGATPVVGATIEAMGPGDSVVSTAITSAEGAYFLELPNGTYKIRAEADKHVPVTKPIVEVPSGTIIVDFSLSYGYMVVFDDFTGTNLNETKWDAHLTGLGSLGVNNATSEPTGFSLVGASSGYGGAGSAALTSKLVVSSEQVVIFEGRVSGYWEAHWYPGVYPDYQPRGLRVGTDPDNAIEFISYARDTVEARTVASGAATVTDYLLPSGQMVGDWNLTYRIEATSAKVKFYVNDVLVATHTTNIPSGKLNIYMGTNYDGYGNVPVSADYLFMATRILGDIDSNLRVDMGDVVSLTKSFGSTMGTSGLYWHSPPCINCPHNPSNDIDSNTRVDMGDIVTCVKNFGKHYP